ncbi:MAG: hypothetical protein KBD51_01940 [Candidatus Levybacteria bacterium]|nr:hypothetical protein [Candidatus Levybacteria bacterium]
MSPEPISREPSRTVDVIRKPNYDLLVNLASPHQPQIQDVLGILDRRSIRDWPIYFPPEETGGVFRVDDIVSPKFFVKERYGSFPLDISDRLSDSREAVREAAEALERNEDTDMEDESLRIKNEKVFQLRQDMAWSSIANEISTAPIVERVLRGDEAQELVAEAGFSGIQFVEPLVGVIDRQGKTLIYQFTDGRKMDELSLTEQQGVRHLSGGLVDLLLASGLVPADLNPSQFLIGQNGNVFLLDSELYFKNS